MKILVISDTHSNVAEALRVIQNHGGLHMFFHLGDTYEDALAIRKGSGLPMRAVSGNMDRLRVGPEMEVFELGGIRFLLAHGDRFGVNRDFIGLSLAAQEADARVVCFGHTHRPCSTSLNGRYFLNPGSLRGESGTYGILRIEGGQISFDILRAAP